MLSLLELLLERLLLGQGDLDLVLGKQGLGHIRAAVGIGFIVEQ